MAVMTIDFRSSALKMNTLVTVLLPDSEPMAGIPLSGRRVLWLLHGLSDDATSWLRLSNVERYALDAGLVAVLPSAGRSMYCDGVLGQDFFTHITRELPEYLSLTLGLSRKRADNCIAGLSMGGMGAMRAALTYPDRYRAACSLSGLIDIAPVLPYLSEERRRDFAPFLDALGDPAVSPLNPAALLENAVGSDLDLSVCCGLQDELLACSDSFFRRAEALGVRVDYYCEDGGHEWDFWDRNIRRFIRRLSAMDAE